MLIQFSDNLVYWLLKLIKLDQSYLKISPLIPLSRLKKKKNSFYTDAFRGIYTDRPKNEDFTFPMIHVYGFSKAQDPEFDFHEVCSEVSS